MSADIEDLDISKKTSINNDKDDNSNVSFVGQGLVQQPNSN